ARFPGHLLELALAQVEEEADSAVFGDQDVGQAVVADVADGDAHAMTRHVQPGAGAGIDKLAVRLLPEEPVLRSLRSTVVHEIDVEKPVAVAIEQRGARAQYLRHVVALLRAGVVDKIEANLLSDIDEPGGAIRLLDLHGFYIIR